MKNTPPKNATHQDWGGNERYPSIFYTLFEHAFESIILLGTDAKVLYINLACSYLLGSSNQATETKAGSGLGLSIVKETVEKLRGSIQVSSS